MYARQLNISNQNSVQFIWLHGWGVDGKTLYPLAENCQMLGDHYILDLPGFGQTPAPQEAWGVKEYTKCVAEFIATLPKKKTIVLGHSFGGRVAIYLANEYPELIHSIVLIAGAGVKPKRSPLFKAYAYIVPKVSGPIKKVFPFLKKVSFSSADYQQASGIMRAIFLKTIHENLIPIAKNIQMPTLLLYGNQDTATPPYFGKAYHEAISKSVLHILPGANHYTILTTYKHQVKHLLTVFMRENS